MNEPAPRNPDDARPAWRLRPASLRRLLWPALLPTVAGLLNRAFRSPPWESAITLVALLLADAAIIATVLALERRRRPPVFRFWCDGSPYRLTVRRRSTGEILLRSECDALAGTELRRVAWAGVDLMSVNLEGADLRDADLRAADLRGAFLHRMDLRRANLAGARLAGARVAGAIFTGADLRGADFAGRGLNRVLWDHDLREADFRGAVYSAATRWPGGVFPEELGCILLETDAECLPIPHKQDSAHNVNLPLPANQTTSRNSS